MRYSFLAVIALSLVACGGADNSKQDNPPEKQDTVSQQVAKKEVKYIMFFGNSLTAGYGLNEDQAFPALIQDRLDSLGLPYKAINAGLSGETSAGGYNRINWVIKQKIDVFFLELGANDALRGLDLESTKMNLRGILDAVLVKYPDIPIIIAGMEAPPNMGPEYTAEFREIYQKLAADYHAHLIPFLLQGVGGKPELNQQDRMHPNAEGEKIVMENVWQVLKDVL